jgi:hypothetical protein
MSLWLLIFSFTLCIYFACALSPWATMVICSVDNPNTTFSGYAHVYMLSLLERSFACMGMTGIITYVDECTTYCMSVRYAHAADLHTNMPGKHQYSFIASHLLLSSTAVMFDKQLLCTDAV